MGICTGSCRARTPVVSTYALLSRAGRIGGWGGSVRAAAALLASRSFAASSPWRAFSADKRLDDVDVAETSDIVTHT